MKLKSVRNVPKGTAFAAGNSLTVLKELCRTKIRFCKVSTCVVRYPVTPHVATFLKKVPDLVLAFLGLSAEAKGVKANVTASVVKFRKVRGADLVSVNVTLSVKRSLID
jgi:hypothetical protein